MRKFLFLIVAAFLLGIPLLSLLTPMSVQAATTGNYFTYEYYEGYVYNGDAVYATAHSAALGDVMRNESTDIIVGQTLSSAVFYVYRAVLVFDTTSLPTDAVIDTATVSLYGKSDSSTTDFNLVLVEGTGITTPLTLAGYKDLQDRVESLNSAFSTSSFSTSAYNVLTLTDDGEGEIVPGGVTKFGLRSSLDIAGTPDPTGNEYVTVWSSEHGVAYQPKLTVTYTLAPLGAPNRFSIPGGVAAFNGYVDDVEPTDQIFLFTYDVAYDTVPDYLASECFYVQLLDEDDDIVAQTLLPEWGYGPGSIYLSSEASLTPSSSYTIQIIGNPDIFDTPPDPIEYDSSNWLGSAPERLDAWVIANARVLQSSDKNEGAEYLVELSGGTKLTYEGAVVFLRGIPNLDAVRPDLFASSEVDYTPPERSTHDPAFQAGLLGNLGVSLTNAFDNLGESVGLDGMYVGAATWIVVMIAIVGIVVVLTGSPTAGVVCAIPILPLGNFTGTFPMVLTAALGVICSGWLFYRIWIH